MASLSTDKQSNRKLQFISPIDSRRKSIYFGKPTCAYAIRTKAHIEALIVHRKEGTTHDAVLIR